METPRSRADMFLTLDSGTPAGRSTLSPSQHPWGKHIQGDGTPRVSTAEPDIDEAVIRFFGHFLLK